jgi:hypothetical protein
VNPIVTANADIRCSHQGQVVMAPGQESTVAEGGPVLCFGDLVGWAIQGCTQPASTNSKPCTAVVSVAGGTAPTVTVGGKPVYLSSLTGVTDGVPPGTLTVFDPGQTTASA